MMQRALVEFHRKPTGNVIASGYNSDSGIGGGGLKASVVYVITYKCEECGGEYTQQATR
jgi:hypothetical protein